MRRGRSSVSSNKPCLEETELKVLVTGATGNIGSAVAESLIARGVPVRLVGTRPAVLQEKFPGAEVAKLDFFDPTTFELAIADATALFLVRPPAIAQVRATVNAFASTAVARRVRHIVFASVAGVERNRLIPHHRIETHLQTLETGWTFLRPGFFSQNLAEAYQLDICEDDRLYLPAGAGRVAFIDTRDIGEAAANILASPAEHDGSSYHVTGPAAVDLSEVAMLLSQELQRPIRYQPASVVGYMRHLLFRHRLPFPQALVQTVLHAGLRRGAAESVVPTLGELLGRPPRSLADFIHDYRAVWLR